VDQVTTHIAGDIIATRAFVDPSGQAVVAILYAPVKVGTDQWKCEFRISGPPKDVEGHVYGFDSLQALTTGVEGLRIQLEQIGEQLRWGVDGERGWLDLSLQIPYAHGLEAQRRWTQLVEDAVAQMVEAEMKVKGRPWPPPDPR
jgi:hypothetical protein